MSLFVHASEAANHGIICPLLDHLVEVGQAANGQRCGWQIKRIAGGWSNLLYRARNAERDLAIKFTVRDKRDRAGREYAALLALQQSGLAIAPQPILLDRTAYPQPVVVMTWLEGEVEALPPVSDADWARLVAHFAAFHSLTPQHTAVQLPQAVLNASSVADGRRLVQQEVARIPHQAQPVALRELVRQLDCCELPQWPQAPVSLCRVDNNTLNFIRRPGPWASVDWENAGWGDPAFDVAGWMTHAAYMDVAPQRWQDVLRSYCGLVDDATAAHRIQVYRKILLVWWVARLARYLYEVPRGLDKRLVAWPEGWQADLQAKYRCYLTAAQRALS